LIVGVTIRIPKTHPSLDRRAARELALRKAEAYGYRPDQLRNGRIHLERVDGSVIWEYIVEFPEAPARATEPG
jgi:hypothetical protein